MSSASNFSSFDFAQSKNAPVGFHAEFQTWDGLTAARSPNHLTSPHPAYVILHPAYLRRTLLGYAALFLKRRTLLTCDLYF
jgi:hypothetical protein